MKFSTKFMKMFVKCDGVRNRTKASGALPAVRLAFACWSWANLKRRKNWILNDILLKISLNNYLKIKNILYDFFLQRSRSVELGGGRLVIVRSDHDEICVLVIITFLLMSVCLVVSSVCWKIEFKICWKIMLLKIWCRWSVEKIEIRCYVTR